MTGLSSWGSSLLPIISHHPILAPKLPGLCPRTWPRELLQTSTLFHHLISVQPWLPHRGLQLWPLSHHLLLL